MKHLNGEYKLSKSEMARALTYDWAFNRISTETLEQFMKNQPIVGNRIAKLFKRIARRYSE